MSDMWTLRDRSDGARLADERFPDPKSVDDRTRSVAWSDRHWVILSPSGVVMAMATDSRPSLLDQVIWDRPTFDTATLLARARAALEEDSGDTEAAMLVECIAELERLEAEVKRLRVQIKKRRAESDRAKRKLVAVERAARSEYRPHRWRWINGFWAECSCGLRESGFLAPPVRRRMEKHVISATAADLAAAQIRAAGRNS